MRAGRETRLEEIQRRWRTLGDGTFLTVELTLNPLRQGAMMLSGSGRAGGEGREGQRCDASRSEAARRVTSVREQLASLSASLILINPAQEPGGEKFSSRSTTYLYQLD